jgi:PAS domain S-box-containing protein
VPLLAAARMTAPGGEPADRPELARIGERWARERRARLEAEAIAEKATRELYQLVRQHERTEAGLRLLHALTLAINGATDLAAALGVTLRLVADATQWVFGQAWTLREDENLLECAKEYFDTDARFTSFRACSAAMTFPRGLGLPGRVWESKTPHWIRDVTTDSNFPRREAAASAGLKSAIGFPVLAGDEVVAVLEFFIGEDRPEDDAMVELISTVATQLGAFVRSKRAEDALRETENLSTTLNSIGDAVIATDPTGRIVRMNPAAERLTGWSLALARGRPLGDVLPLLDAATNSAVPELTAQVIGDEKIVGPSNHKLHLPHGEGERSIVDTAAPIRDSSGRTTGCVVVLRDTTELRKMEARLALAERMASVGTLAAGVAHEINNPLAYVLGNIDFVSTELQSMKTEIPSSRLDEVGQALLEARHGGERVRRIVRDLKIFSRAEEEKGELIDVRSVIESSINMAWNEIRHRARLVKDFGAVEPVEANPSRLGQVFLNLLINAAQSIPIGRADRNEIRIATRTDAVGRSIIEISDTGSGMPPHVLSRIFDPFFTTKAIGVGTGLGLSICQGIVSALDGEISVESEVGKGTSFRIALPAARDHAPEPVCEPRAEEAAGRARVLVIDDEPFIGRVIRRALRADFDVVAIECAREALERISAGEHFDVILCDLMMPEMTGMELHAELTSFDRSLARRMIFVTGGAFTEPAQEFLNRDGILRAEKPIDVQSIRALIHSLLR